MKNLEILHLNFEDCDELTDNSLTDLDLNVKGPTNILGCLSFKNGDEKTNVPNLTKILPKLLRLTTFNISFAGCGGIKNNGIIELGKAIRQLPSLIDLSVDLQRCDIAEKALYSLYSSIS